MKNFLNVGFVAAIIGVGFFACEDPAITNPADPNYILKPPTLLSVEPITDTKIELRWKDNEEHTKEFVIQRKMGSESFITRGVVAENTLSFLDTACVLNMTYSYVIRSKVETNLSDGSEAKSANTSFSAPTEFSASSLIDSEIQLNWTDNTDYETGFKIERNSGSGFEEIAMVLANVTEYTDIGLTFGQIFEYRVAAYTEINISDYSAITRAPSCEDCIVIDYDDNMYESIQIGDQIWMAENLKVTHYRDGTSISHVTDNTSWENLYTGAYCIYNNNASNEVDVYGVLYNWYAVNGDTDGDGEKDKEIAPEGWHVPTNDEWKEMEMYLGMSQLDAGGFGWRGTNEGSKLAGNADLWNNGALENASEFDSSGFTALPAGFCNYSQDFYNIMDNAIFWSATNFNSTDAWHRKLGYNNSDVFWNIKKKRYGLSIRLLKD
jgi:uncharacterized protein (TIGR02145 family)